MPALLRPARLALIALGFGGLALAVARRSGAFDALSIVVEYRARADVFQAALVRHLGLSLGALGAGARRAIPLGWLAFRGRARPRGRSTPALSGIQVVPAVAAVRASRLAASLALGAWPRLRELGLAAIGPTPALIGVAAYLALPLTRGPRRRACRRRARPDRGRARAWAWASAVSPAEVRLPLGLPVFVAGLRVATVQAIGLVTLGGLIGAGGLGALVFEGMAQFAPDLIILGSAPVVAIAVLADLGLRALELRVARPLS